MRQEARGAMALDSATLPTGNPQDTSRDGSLSVWLVPDVRQTRCIVDTMRRLATAGRRAACIALDTTGSDGTSSGQLHQQHGTDFPTFAPHVTVGFVRHSVGAPVVSALLTRLAEAGPAFDVEWAAIAVGPSFVQCVFLDAVPSERLSNLNAAFQAAFGMRCDYHPHLSLAYADVGGDARLALAADARAQSDELLRPLTMHALELWDTSGPVDGWRRLAAAPLAAAAMAAPRAVEWVNELRSG